MYACGTQGRGWSKVMKIIRFSLLLFLGALLVSGIACGEGQGAEPTPTATVEPTATTETAATVESTPTATDESCPPPSEGNANIKGVIMWNGQPWVDEFGTRAIVKLYPIDSFTESMGSLKFLEGGITDRTTADFDGSFCFHDIEPGEYYIVRDCPTGYSAASRGPYTVKDGQVYVGNWPILSVTFDPYESCEHRWD
jgi:hypothetical protein